MLALTDPELLAVLEHRMRSVKEKAGIDEADPFSLVLDTVEVNLKTTLQATWRSTQGHQKAATDLAQATADFAKSLSRLEKKVDLVDKRVAAAQRRTSDVVVICTAAVAIFAACMATVQLQTLTASPGISNGLCAAPLGSGAVPEQSDRAEPDPTGEGRVR